MSNEKYNNQNLIVGAAVVVGILGTLSALMRSNRSVKNWKNQAKDVAYHVLEKGEMVNKNMMLGGVTGGLIGAVAALLLAPKAGFELIKDLTHPFSHPNPNIRKSASSKSPSPKLASHKKKASRSKEDATHNKAAVKTEEHKTHKTVHKRKSPTRRRTAIAALKQAAMAPEKVVTEVKEAQK